MSCFATSAKRRLLPTAPTPACHGAALVGHYFPEVVSRTEIDQLAELVSAEHKMIQTPTKLPRPIRHKVQSSRKAPSSRPPVSRNRKEIWRVREKAVFFDEMRGTLSVQNLKGEVAKHKKLCQMWAKKQGHPVVNYHWERTNFEADEIKRLQLPKQHYFANMSDSSEVKNLSGPAKHKKLCQMWAKNQGHPVVNYHWEKTKFKASEIKKLQLKQGPKQLYFAKMSDTPAVKNLSGAAKHKKLYQMWAKNQGHSVVKCHWERTNFEAEDIEKLNSKLGKQRYFAKMSDTPALKNLSGAAKHKKLCQMWAKNQGHEYPSYNWHRTKVHLRDRKKVRGNPKLDFFDEMRDSFAIKKIKGQAAKHMKLCQLWAARTGTQVSYGWDRTKFAAQGKKLCYQLKFKQR